MIDAHMWYILLREIEPKENNTFLERETVSKKKWFLENAMIISWISPFYRGVSESLEEPEQPNFDRLQ